MFNRDEPFREKEINVIVRATDEGAPKLEAICLFTVTIEDINDNAPTFDKVVSFRKVCWFGGILLIFQLFESYNEVTNWPLARYCENISVPTP